MRESLISIPISEVFEPKCGCPLCRMHDTLESRCVEYIMGAAMMEPDIRVETNKQGFCAEHYGMLLSQRNRLSLALMLETHLREVRDTVFEKPGLFDRGAEARQKRSERMAGSCFVCGNVGRVMDNLVDTMFGLYRKEEDFRRLFAEQEYICLPHYRQLAALIPVKLPKKEQSDFFDVLDGLVRRSLDALCEDVSHYCSMYDYRNSGKNADWGNARDSIERAILFLTSKEYRKQEKTPVHK